MAYAGLQRESNDYNSDNKFATELLRCYRTILLSQSRLQSTGVLPTPPTGQMCNHQGKLAPIAGGLNPPTPGNSHTVFVLSEEATGICSQVKNFCSGPVLEQRIGVRV
jgi:hypothetical protein